MGNSWTSARRRGGSSGKPSVDHALPNARPPGTCQRSRRTSRYAELSITRPRKSTGAVSAASASAVGSARSPASCSCSATRARSTRCSRSTRRWRAFCAATSRRSTPWADVPGLDMWPVPTHPFAFVLPPLPFSLLHPFSFLLSPFQLQEPAGSAGPAGAAARSVRAIASAIFRPPCTEGSIGLA